MTSKQRKRPRIVREPGTVQLGRDRRGRFAQGNQISRGNRGRKAQRGLSDALDRVVKPEDWRAIVRSARQAARGGDAEARRWLADRAAGRPRVEPDDSVLALELPALVDASSCAEASAEIVRAAAAGEVTLEMAARCMSLVDAAREGVVLVDLHDRIEALEQTE